MRCETSLSKKRLRPLSPRHASSQRASTVRLAAFVCPTSNHWILTERRGQTEHSAVCAGSRLKLNDVPGRSCLISQPSSRNEKNLPCGMIGGSRKRRYHSKP